MGVTVAARGAGRRPESSGRVIEIAGPPGAGKTTLLEALRLTSADIHVPRLRQTRYRAWFIATAVASTPMPVRRPAGCGLGWRERMIMVHLGALHRMVPRAPGRRIHTVFDQGPIFMLTRLYGCGVPQRANAKMRRWWDATIERWASTVDTVIRLDAPDTVLMQRIRTRAKSHVIKRQPEADVHEFLHSFRRTSDVVLSRLAGGASGTRVLEFDTSRLDVNEIVPVILGELRQADLREAPHR